MGECLDEAIVAQLTCDLSLALWVCQPALCPHSMLSHSLSLVTGVINPWVFNDTCRICCNTKLRHPQIGACSSSSVFTEVTRLKNCICVFCTGVIRFHITRLAFVWPQPDYYTLQLAVVTSVRRQQCVMFVRHCVTRRDCEADAGSCDGRLCAWVGGRRGWIPVSRDYGGEAPRGVAGGESSHQVSLSVPTRCGTQHSRNHLRQGHGVSVWLPWRCGRPCGCPTSPLASVQGTSLIKQSPWKQDDAYRRWEKFFVRKLFCGITCSSVMGCLIGEHYY